MKRGRHIRIYNSRLKINCWCIKVMVIICRVIYFFNAVYAYTHVYHVYETQN